MAVLTLCETGFASRGLTQDRGTPNTQHDCLSMAEHRRDLVAAWKWDMKSGYVADICLLIRVDEWKVQPRLEKATDDLPGHFTSIK